jgi:hypothetical protein
MATTSTVTKVTKPAARPGGQTSAPLKPTSQQTTPTKSGLSLLQQYESQLSNAGRGTEGNPLGDYTKAAETYWDSTGGQRAYADKLRGQARGHESSMQAQQIGGQKAIAGIDANTQRYLGDLGLQGTKVSTQGRIKEAEIGARTQRGVAATQAGSEKYSADLQYKSSLAGYQSNKDIESLRQGGENYRSGLDLAGRLLTNQADNYTARQGQFFDYMGRKAQSQHQAPTTSNIKYWAG